MIEHQAVGQVAGRHALALVQFVKDRGDRPRCIETHDQPIILDLLGCGGRLREDVGRQGRVQHGIAQRRRLDVVPRIAELQPLFALPTERVEEDDRLPGGRGVDLCGQGLLRRAEQFLSLRQQRGIARQALVVHALDRRAGQDVVELVEQHFLPDGVQRRTRVVGAGQPVRHGRHPLRLAQHLLHTPVVPLVGGVGGEGALVALQVEFALPGGKAIGILHPFLEEGRGPLLLHGRQAGKIAQPRQPLQVFLARPAAAVANAVGHERVAGDALVAVVLLDHGQRARRGRAVVGLLRQHVHQHGGSVDALPAERLVREGVDQAPAQLLCGEIADAGARHDLRQRTRVAKGVGQPDIVDVDAKFI